ncbi:MAG TPA: twin-arginine translocation signal domain-containing protein, partial [Pirellulaceae bacterium]
MTIMTRFNFRCDSWTDVESLRPPEISGSISRRAFLQAATAASALAWADDTLADSAKDVNSDIRLAVIGLRGRGGSHMEGMGRHVTALCDVDAKVLAGWRERLQTGKQAR